jgi:hypothetical protein
MLTIATVNGIFIWQVKSSPSTRSPNTVRNIELPLPNKDLKPAVKSVVLMANIAMTAINVNVIFHRFAMHVTFVRPLWYSNLMRGSNVDFSLPICMKFSQYLTDTHSTDTAYKETNQTLSMYIQITKIPATCRISPSRGKTTEALEESLHKSLAVNSSFLRSCRALSMISSNAGTTAIDR